MTQPILVLDIEPDNLLLIEQTIKRNLSGVETVGLTEPREALAWCVLQEPDLCFIDYKMPGMSGIDFLTRLRAHARFAGVPMIMISGGPGGELKQQALNSGVTDFINKPINVADVVARARNHLRLSSVRPAASAMDCENRSDTARCVLPIAELVSECGSTSSSWKSIIRSRHQTERTPPTLAARTQDSS